MDINNLYDIEISGNKINSKELFELIVQNYSNKGIDYDLLVDGKLIQIQIKKIQGGYEIKEDKNIIYLTQKNVYFLVNGKKFFQKIYCIENFIFLLNYFNFKSPYMIEKSITRKINMPPTYENSPFIFSKESELVVFEGEPESYEKYIVSKEDYQKNIENNEPLTLKSLGKYARYYIKGMKEDEPLFYYLNFNMNKLQLETAYLDGDSRDIGLFNFLTSSEKGGKTFSLLVLNITEKEHYRIYFNDRLMTELGEQGNYDEFKKIFFYEISKIFKTYDEYVEFSKSFFISSQSDQSYNTEFKAFILEFIDEMEKFAKKNKDKYSKIMLLFDDFELDETKPETFQKNYNFLTSLFEKKWKNSLIHFSFISPINENYIQTCVKFGIELKYNPIPGVYTRKDKKTNKIYFPYIYIDTCFYSDDCYKDYIDLINEKNAGELNIPNKYLRLINYSLYHLNNIKNLCAENNNKNIISSEAEKYIQNLGPKIDEFTSDFYENNNVAYPYKYDLDKLNEYHDLISKEPIIQYEIIFEALKFIPFRFVSFYFVTMEQKNDEIYHLYKISYRTIFHKNSINKYLQQFENADYEKKNITPGERGERFEKRVISAIQNNYFDNFRPDITVQLGDIYCLTEYNDYNKKNYQKIIDTFNKIFSEGKNNLILIKQKKPNAKRYDLAFLQKYGKKKFQFILGQITTKKSKSDMIQYTEVKNDCYKFANFFSLFDDIFIDRFHFFFIFKAGINEDKSSIDFCLKSNIKFIKYCEKNNEQYFLDEENKKLNILIFDLKSFSLVECITNKNLDKLDNLSSSSDYSLIGKKRTTINRLSEAKYIFGISIYNKVSALFGKKNYELCENVCSLEEDKFFYICYRKIGNEGKIYFLIYLQNGEKKISIINNNSLDIYKYKVEDLQKEIDKPGTIFKCFQFLNNP